MKFNNETIREAVNLWLEDEAAATKKYVFINDWDTSEVTDMSKLFLNAHEFNSPIGDWDVSNVTTMHAMFDNAFRFNQNINNWDVRNVKDMSEMFSSSDSLDFNQPLNNWDVSNVTNMSHMFFSARCFNQPLNNWDVRNVTTMHDMFASAFRFNQNINNWDVSNVSDMSLMFHNAKSFNQPLDNWDVSNVTNMSNMFIYAESFNQPLNNWDVSSVTDISRMFADAKSFNQPLDNWDVSNVTKFINWNIKVEEYVKKFSFEIDKYKYLTKKSFIRINHDFKLDFKDNKFILIDYEWNGGNDFNYNIFNEEPLPEEEFIGSSSSSELTISVNDTTLYIKHFEIQDGPLEEGDYIGISKAKDFKNIEWYDAFSHKNSELIKIISLLSISIRNEDLWYDKEFLNDFDELAFYIKEGAYYDFDKVEFNVEIDLKKLQKYDEHIFY